MNQLPLEKDVILKRMDGITGEIAALKRLGQKDIDTFKNSESWQLAQYHLHRALEGVFHIGTHILSRIPGAQATQYKEIAKKLGEYKIVPQEFADTKLVEMAKYRNRLVHFYAQITPEELYGVLKKDLGDFEVFLRAVGKLLKHPETIGLTAV